MNELLVAEILHDIDSSVEVEASGPTVRDLDVLGTEAGDAAGSTCAVHDLRGHEIHRGRTDETGDEQVARLAVELLGSCCRTPSFMTAIRSPIVIAST